MLKKHLGRKPSYGISGIGKIFGYDFGLFGNSMDQYGKINSVLYYQENLHSSNKLTPRNYTIVGRFMLFSNLSRRRDRLQMFLFFYIQILCKCRNIKLKPGFFACAQVPNFNFQENNFSYFDNFPFYLLPTSKIYKIEIKLTCSASEMRI